MIKKIEFEIIHCDGCGKMYESGGCLMFIDVENRVTRCEGWIKDGNKHYCKSCAEIRGMKECAR